MIDALNSLLVKYSSTSALFFVEDGILINTASQSPFFVLQEGVSLSNIRIESAFLCDAIMVIKGNVDKQLLSSRGLSLPSVKTFLTTATSVASLILKAHHWLHWDKIARYCGHCAAPLMLKFDSPQRTCDVCTLSFFPRFSPAVMVLIKKEHEILLARSRHFSPGVYSAIAGFIEPGETAEMAAHREVKEELGIEIQSLVYFGTQPWPFPDSFMIAFTAEYAKGDLKIDATELEDARWFSKEALPVLPYSASIAYYLIQSVLNPS